MAAKRPLPTGKASVQAEAGLSYQRFNEGFRSFSGSMYVLHATKNKVVARIDNEVNFIFSLFRFNKSKLTTKWLEF